MTEFPVLDGLRIGCVKYLNSKPLIHAYRGPVVFDHPSGLARGIAAGELDVALVPIFEVLRGWRCHLSDSSSSASEAARSGTGLPPVTYQIVDGVAIASDGPVYSVFLAHRVPLSEIKTMALDPASRTSAHLVQVLLREYHGIAPRCIDPGDSTLEPDAKLLIGNQAIEFRQRPGASKRILDLGDEWKRCTGLPFVYATWLLRPGLKDPQGAAAELRRLRSAGLQCLPEIIRAETERNPSFTERYLTQHIRFELGEREKAGIDRFRELLTKHQFIASRGELLEYV